MKSKFIIGALALIVVIVLLKFNVFSPKVMEATGSSVVRQELLDENGNLLSLTEFDKETTKGTKKNYKNGRLVSIAEIVDGKKNGLTKNFYNDGGVSSEVNYIDNSREGKATWYHQNGAVYRVSNYKDNKLDGKRTFYYKNGKVKAELEYSKGDLLPGIKEYTNTGKLIEDQPKFIFKEISRDQTQVIIRAYISNNDKNAEFLQKGDNDIYNMIASENGELKIYRRPPTAEHTEKIEIYALTKSKLNYDLLIKGEHIVK